ncbi:MAG TPA: DUF3105 domain-containing protein [Polyangiaceae bacterium]
MKFRAVDRTALALPLLLACSAAERHPEPPGSSCGDGSVSSSATTGAYSPAAIAESACGAVITEEPLDEPLHVEACTPITYATNPPSSGRHYSDWADFTIFEEPVARGYWVHSLEHGAVVIAYSCADCEEEIAAARSLLDELPEDPLCGLRGAEKPNRAILTPDPLLDVPWAAAAWGYTLRSECFEPHVFRDFALARLGLGPENFCAAGAVTP